MHWSPKKLGAAALAAALGAVGLGFSAHANSSFTLTRVAGTDRYATASAVAANAFTSATPNVVIARGDDFADALSGAYLAGILGSGSAVLLTQTSALPQSTKDRLIALGAKNVYLLGGTVAISQAVQDNLAKSYTVTRIAGQNRYDTASKVAQQTNATGIGTVAGAKTAIIANGLSYPDALSAGSAAFAARFPIVLTTTGALPAESSAALTALGIKHAVIVGGTAVVSGDVVNQLTTMGINSDRVAGQDRYETSTKMADYEVSAIAGWSTSQVDLASGEGFADALAGGPAAGRALRPIILTAAGSLSTATATWLQTHAASLQGGRVFGGTSAISDATVTAAETAAGAGSAPQTGQVTSVDTTNHRYTFVPTGATAPLTVSYKTSDTFSIDSTSATMAAFENALTAADNITYTPANGSTPASHILTNVNPATITSGTVGDVVESASPPPSGTHTFKFVNPVTGDALTPAINYAAGTYSIDGTAGKTVTDFGADLNEGDTVTITGTAFALTNQSVTGPANTITKGTAVTPTTFKIGNLGDDPTMGDNPPVTTGNDTVFKASSTDTYTGEANATTFPNLLSDGDTVTYSRKAGVQTFNLVNKAPTQYTGQAVGTITKNPVDGSGSFTLATSTMAVTINYTADPSAVWIVNGAASTKSAFEAAYSPGDLITFQAADATVPTVQRMELTDQSIAGRIPQTGINTTAAPNSSGQAGHTYQVLANNGFTVLATVTYATSTASDNVYVVNGASVDQAAFETALNSIASGSKGGSVVVTTAGTVQTHNLTVTP